MYYKEFLGFQYTCWNMSKKIQPDEFGRGFEGSCTLCHKRERCAVVEAKLRKIYEGLHYDDKDYGRQRKTDLICVAYPDISLRKILDDQLERELVWHLGELVMGEYGRDYWLSDYLRSMYELAWRHVGYL